jgi:hypothetical protein
VLTLRREISCLTLWVVCGSVFAQDTGKTDAAAAAAAAMERAQRQAANPMRIILEASKVRPRPTADVASLANPATSVATKGADPGVIGPRMAVAQTAPTPAPLPTQEPAAATAPQPRLSGDSLQRQASAQVVPALEASGSSAQAVPAVPVLEVAAPTVVATPIRPKILSMVEPSIPPRALDDAGPLGTIEVDLTIRSDGSVAAVEVVPPVSRQIQRYVILALEQWRFEPLPSERMHRVQLVFNKDR